MAIALRSFSVAGTAVVQTNPTTLVTTAPSGKTVGDLLILAVTSKNRTAATPTLSLTTGSAGWNSATPFSSASINAASFMITRWWWKVADGSAGDTPTLSAVLSEGAIQYNLLAITGANNVSPGDVGAAASATTAAVTAIPAITTTVAGDMQIGLVSTQDTNGSGVPTFTVPSGFTTSGSVAVTGNASDGQFAFYRIVNSASALPAVNVTKTGTFTQQTMSTIALFAGTATTTNKIGWGVAIA